jgi:hypothetical protein
MHISAEKYKHFHVNEENSCEQRRIKRNIASSKSIESPKQNQFAEVVFYGNGEFAEE